VERAFANWIEGVPQIRLDPALAESALVINRVPTLVDDVRSAGRVHGPLARAAGLTSYVAAPIVAGDRVIGLLHADLVGREVEPEDRDLLWAFATGFGQVFERAVLLARLREQRTQVMHLMKTVEGVLDELASAEVELARRGQIQATADVTAPAVVLRPFDSSLTAREEEVLSLMATGATNDRIAERLVIATGTVKSHVKQILRKLEVENRAEAIAVYLKHSYGAAAG
jgi:DNA-binding CsgD family transcriptional regulator